MSTYRGRTVTSSTNSRRASAEQLAVSDMRAQRPAAEVFCRRCRWFGSVTA